MSDVEDVHRYKKILDDPEAAPQELLGALERLGEIDIDKALLAKTKVGVSVQKLKSSEDDAIKVKSRKLLEKWRQAVGIAKKPESAKSQAKSNGAIEPENGEAEEKPLFSTELEFPGPFCNDVKRDKVRSILFKAFLEGLPTKDHCNVDFPTCGMIATQVEEALWKHHIQKHNNQKEYNAQLRSLKANLADKKNPEFNVRIYVGSFTPEALATMTAPEMASDAKKRERQKARKDALEACQSDWDLRNLKQASGQFPCGKCKSANTTYYQLQTRSADEPMTTFVTCRECGNRWKF